MVFREHFKAVGKDIFISKLDPFGLGLTLYYGRIDCACGCSIAVRADALPGRFRPTTSVRRCTVGYRIMAKLA